MVRFFYKEKESVNAKVLKVGLQYCQLMTIIIKRGLEYIVLFCAAGCEVHHDVGRLWAVHHGAPGEDAAYQVQVQGGGGQKTWETTAEGESEGFFVLH